MNLAKLFKLPKKLGDSMLISLINNMVDYLRTYDSVIKVDDNGNVIIETFDEAMNFNSNGGSILFNTAGPDDDYDDFKVKAGYIELESIEQSDILLKSDGSLILETLQNNWIYLQSGGRITLESNNGKSIYLNSSGEINISSDNACNIYLNADDVLSLQANSNVYIESGNGGSINIDSNVYITDNNGAFIELDSSIAIQAEEGARIVLTDSIIITANMPINITSNTGDIYLKATHNGVTLESGDGEGTYLHAIDQSENKETTIEQYGNGIIYRQKHGSANEIYFRIDADGKIYGTTINKTIDYELVNNSTTNDHIMKFILRSPFDNNTEAINVTEDNSESGDITINCSNINCIGLLEVFANNTDYNTNSAVTVKLLYVMEDGDEHEFIKSYDFMGIHDNPLTRIEIPVDLNHLEKFTIIYDNDYCYTADTLITLADGSTKQVKDITYDDELKVWNFDEGKDDVAKPLWIKRTEHAKSYQLVTLSDGNTIKLCGSDGKYHCMFDVTEQKFNHAVDCIGHEVYTENGIATVVSIEEVKEKVDHYNIVTNYHMNLYANHILTSTEKNNIYPIADMKFVKDDRKIVPYEEFEKAHISREYYDGWRAGEWSEPLKDVITHLRRRKMYAKPQKRVKDGLRTDYFG